MKAIYSCPMVLNSPGPSRPMTRIHQGLSTILAGRDDAYHLLEPSMFPQLHDANGLGHAIGPAFDDVARNRLPAWTDGVFLGGGGASYRQMQDMQAAGLKCGTLWFSSHWRHAQRILTDEYMSFGLRNQPIHPYVVWRAQVEQQTSDFIVVPSDYCKSTYPEELHDKIHIAEFGVDTTAYTVKPKRTTGRLQVLFPATNPYRKGLRYALQAWEGLDAAKFQMTITGCGIEQKTLPQSLAPILSTGWVQDHEMDDFYTQSDVLLLPSLEEGQALATLEAMASGLPLIVTPETGIPITDGKEGFVVPSRDSKGIHDALLYLQTHEYEYHRMSAAARKFAEARTWTKFSDRIHEIMQVHQ